MVTVDGAYMKKVNRGIILKNIIRHEYISRADISQKTGLNKATVSVQVADLLKEGLVTESTIEHSTIGRKPIMLSINAEAGYVLGIDLDYKKIQFTILNLKGQPVDNHMKYLDSTNYEETVGFLARHIQHFKEKYADSKYGLIHTIIGVHGTIDKASEVITFVPRSQWKNKDLKADLKQRIDMKINLENNANLAAFAETVYKHHQSEHLISIQFTSGVGAGIVIEGKRHHGYAGYAGELGHMVIVPEGKSCACGNEGCWGQYVSEAAILEQISNFLEQPDVTYKDVQLLIEENHPVITDYLMECVYYLTLGLNNIINFYNPETIVLNSELLQINPQVITMIEEKLKSSVNNYRNIVLSELGPNACVLGAGVLAIKEFLQVPEVRFSLDKAPAINEEVLKKELVH